MTQDEIICMAREAGLATTDHGNPNGYAEFCTRLERFANRVAEATKERAAKVCEKKAAKVCEKNACYDLDWNAAVNSCAAAIRSMK